MKQVADHNSAKWLAVRHVPDVGWVVVRTCPCCRQYGGRPELVTIPLESEDRAKRALTALLAVTERLERTG